MKTKIALVVLFVWIGSQSFSQVKPFRFGVKVAPNINWISPDSKGYESDGSSLGFSWGFMADITLADNYFIKTGFNLDYLGGKLKYPVSGSEDGTILGPGMLQRKYNLRYLDVPLTIKMRTNQFDKKAFFGEVGFGSAFNLKAKGTDEYVSDNGQTTQNSESDINDQITFFKSSLLVGAGMEYFIDESTSLVFSINFSNGLTNILKGDNSKDPSISQKAHLYGFQLNFGVLF